MIKYESHFQLNECFELETKILGVMVSIRLRLVYFDPRFLISKNTVRIGQYVLVH